MSICEFGSFPVKSSLRFDRGVSLQFEVVDFDWIDVRSVQNGIFLSHGVQVRGPSDLLDQPCAIGCE